MKNAKWLFLSIMMAFIGVPLLAVIFGVLRGIVNALLRKKGLSTDSRDYASSQHPYP